MKKAIVGFFGNVKEKVLNAYEFTKKNALAMVASITAVVPVASVMTVCADPSDSELVTNVLGLIFKIFRYIGILLLAWSIGMLVLAFKNEDADSKSRAIMMMVVSVVLVGIELLFDGLGITI